jgi:hypothetical protein
VFPGVEGIVISVSIYLTTPLDRKVLMADNKSCGFAQREWQVFLVHDMAVDV